MWDSSPDVVLYERIVQMSLQMWDSSPEALLYERIVLLSLQLWDFSRWSGIHAYSSNVLTTARLFSRVSALRTNSSNVLTNVRLFSRGSGIHAYSSNVLTTARLFSRGSALRTNSSIYNPICVHSVCMHKKIKIESKHLEDSERVLVVQALESRQEQEIFLFSQTFRRVLGPTQVLTQCVRGWGRGGSF